MISIHECVSTEAACHVEEEARKLKARVSLHSPFKRGVCIKIYAKSSACDSNECIIKLEYVTSGCGPGNTKQWTDGAFAIATARSLEHQQSASQEKSGQFQRRNTPEHSYSDAGCKKACFTYDISIVSRTNLIVGTP